MRISYIDHLVITTANLKQCLDFYVGVLGMRHIEQNGHHSLLFPHGKISLHTIKGEFQPSAANPEYGAQDFCLIVDDDLDKVRNEIAAKGYTIEEGIVTRHGSRGLMQSIYLRDPDGNLIELSSYKYAEMKELMLERGIHQDVIDTIGLCGIDLDHWLEGFHDTEDSVRNTVNTIRNHPLVSKDVNLHGYIIDSQTGKLTEVK